ncbi:hypothetical protein HPP92_022033 [Vanilla planifolia]|uniref:BTB domain-containing protein n=2 Tax=Vanilla planifolia TaxID=51239 RepID=A0A835UF96_VANPL|nr:hypothetical protein HPP92_022373 [Vanilla planifolia]KAG0458905.1 hypothetical protein HPP92_022033 [Vanilla planifolia]
MEIDNASQPCTFGDQNSSDVTVLLYTWEGRPVFFYCHSKILIRKSKFFAEQLSMKAVTNSSNEFSNFIQVLCQGSEFDSYAKLLKLLYTSDDSVLESLDSVKTTLGVLRASIALHCGSITKCCMQYLEAVPWDEKEEDEILKIAPSLGPAAKPILARIQPINLTATKNVFVSAIRFATAVEKSFPPFADELKTSAQEQVEYMLLEDEDTPMVAIDEEVKSEVRTGLSNLIATFEAELSLIPLGYKHSPEVAEQSVLQSLSDLDWMCGVLTKMEMLKDFVTSWSEISDKVLAVLQEDNCYLGLWSVKVKVIELVGKAFDAIGFGNVVLPTHSRLHFLKKWLPYLRDIKPLLDAKSDKDESFTHRLDGDLCQNIEGAIVSLVLTLPSCDQADILGDWIQRTEQLKFPNLSEAFEVWCYRTKSANRRNMVELSDAGNPTLSL